MAASGMKLLVLALCLNTFMYLGVNYAMYENIPQDQRPQAISGDIFDIMLSDRSAMDDELNLYVQRLNNTENYTSSYKLNLSGQFSARPNEISGSDIGETGVAIGFLDGARTVFAFIRTLWRIGIMPMTLFTYNVLPPLVAIILGLPLVLLNVFAWIILIRGGGAT